MLAHQYLEQLPRDVRASIFGNIGSTLFFQVGSTDAALLEREGYFEEGYRRHRRLAALPFSTLHAVILQNGSNAMLQVQTAPPPDPLHCFGEVIKAYSRKRYAMRLKDMEAYIRERFAEGDDLPHIRIKA